MARKLVKTADSPSLWNYSLSPGWTQETSEILRLAIIKFGCGNWQAIIDSRCLPGKTRSQLNLQTQRMIGQQSIAEFKGIHLDPRQVWKDVQEKHRNNPNVFIKNGLIINTGNALTSEEKSKLRRINTQKYSLPRSVVSAVELPVVDIDEVVAEGKGKRRRVKEKRKLAPGEEEKLKARLQVLRDRLTVLEKELKDRGVTLVDSAQKRRSQLAAMSRKVDSLTKRKRASDEEPDEAPFEINDFDFDEEEEIIEEEIEEIEEIDEEVEIIEEEAAADEGAEGDEESGFSGEEGTANGYQESESAPFYFGEDNSQLLVADGDGGKDDDDSDFEEPSTKKRRLAPTRINDTAAVREMGPPKAKPVATLN